MNHKGIPVMHVSQRICIMQIIIKNIISDHEDYRKVILIYSF